MQSFSFDFFFSFSFQAASHNLFFLLRLQRAERTRSGSQRAHRRTRVMPFATERVWATAEALAPAVGGLAALRGMARRGAARLGAARLSAQPLVLTTPMQFIT